LFVVVVLDALRSSRERPSTGKGVLKFREEETICLYNMMHGDAFKPFLFPVGRLGAESK
jgi:hypothetical protein